jgi:hypothetical protein
MSDCQEDRRRRDRVRCDEVMSFPVLQIRRHGVIDGQDGDVRVCASVGPADEVVAVWTTAEGMEAVTSRTVSAGGASFPDPGATRPVAARITVHAPELAAVMRIQDLTAPSQQDPPIEFGLERHCHQRDQSCRHARSQVGVLYN